MTSASQTTISLSASACFSPSISFLFVFKSPERQAGLCSNAGLILIFPSVDKENDVCFFKWEINGISISLSSADPDLRVYRCGEYK